MKSGFSASTSGVHWNIALEHVLNRRCIAIHGSFKNGYRSFRSSTRLQFSTRITIVSAFFVALREREIIVNI
jgi:hypothetical protein